MKSTIVATLLILAAQTPPPERRVLNLYEWSAVAPVVVAGTSLGDDGKWHDFELEQVLRGKPGPDRVRVALQQANRDRDRVFHRFALHLTEGESYLLLLQPIPASGKARTQPAFRLVRGLDGIRELPAEGRQALVDAVQRLIDVQDLRDDRRIWEQLSAMLEETNPILLGTALEQFIKFNRGEPEQFASLRPLLDHPSPELRERVARLISQTLRKRPGAAIPDGPQLRAELIARARRDGDVQVRMAATEALDGFADRAIVDVLTEIADTDPDQSVRYAAEKLVYDRLRRQASREGASN